MIISNTDAYRVYPNPHPKGKLTTVSVKRAPHFREAELTESLADVRHSFEDSVREIHFHLHVFHVGKL